MQIVFKNSFAKVLFLALLTVALGIGVSAQTVADVDAVVQKMIDAKTIPAAGVAVVRDGKVVVAKGYGMADAEAGTPANENTGFQMVRVRSCRMPGSRTLTLAFAYCSPFRAKISLDEKWSGRQLDET